MNWTKYLTTLRRGAGDRSRILAHNADKATRNVSWPNSEPPVGFVSWSERFVYTCDYDDRGPTFRTIPVRPPQDMQPQAWPCATCPRVAKCDHYITDNCVASHDSWDAEQAKRRADETAELLAERTRLQMQLKDARRALRNATARVRRSMARHQREVDKVGGMGKLIPRIKELKEREHLGLHDAKAAVFAAAGLEYIPPVSDADERAVVSDLEQRLKDIKHDLHLWRS